MASARMLKKQQRRQQARLFFPLILSEAPSGDLAIHLAGRRKAWLLTGREAAMVQAALALPRPRSTAGDESLIAAFSSTSGSESNGSR